LAADPVSGADTERRCRSGPPRALAAFVRISFDGFGIAVFLTEMASSPTFRILKYSATQRAVGIPNDFVIAPERSWYGLSHHHAKILLLDARNP
jgi:hypothetical protein